MQPKKKPQLRHTWYKIKNKPATEFFLKKQISKVLQSPCNMYFPTLPFFSSSPNLHSAYLKALKYQDQQIHKCQMRRSGKTAADSKLTNHCCLTIQSGYWTLSEWMNETDCRIHKKGNPTALSLKSCKRAGIQPMMHACSKGVLLNTELFSVGQTGNCKENWRFSLPS